MRLVVSGEGASDIGLMEPANTGYQFRPGPITKLLDQLCEAFLQYSLLGAEQVHFISESDLSATAKASSNNRRIRLPSKKNGKETGYFYRNAEALALYAREHFPNEPVYPVLFRDSDGTNTTPRGEWIKKYESMINGFLAGGTQNGIPMLAKPKSEAWFLCALKSQPYQNCENLEQQPGNDQSPNSLKRQLEEQLGTPGTAEVLNEKIEQGEINPHDINMPSFNVIKDRVAALLNGARQA